MSDDEKRTLRSDDLVGIPLAVLVDDLAWYLGYTRAFIEGSPRGERVHAALRAATDAAIEGGAVAAVGRPRGSRGGLMATTEPFELNWHNIAKVLKDEAWEGRWPPLDESNIGPLAGVTAAAFIAGFERLGLRLVAVNIEPPRVTEATAPSRESLPAHSLSRLGSSGHIRIIPPRATAPSRAPSEETT